MTDLCCRKTVERLTTQWTPEALCSPSPMSSISPPEEGRAIEEKSDLSVSIAQTKHPSTI
jgi:hypothetical protein